MRYLLFPSWSFSCLVRACCSWLLHRLLLLNRAFCCNLALMVLLELLQYVTEGYIRVIEPQKQSTARKIALICCTDVALQIMSMDYMCKYLLICCSYMFLLLLFLRCQCFAGKLIHFLPGEFLALLDIGKLAKVMPNFFVNFILSNSNQLGSFWIKQKLKSIC